LKSFWKKIIKPFTDPAVYSTETSFADSSVKSMNIHI